MTRRTLSTSATPEWRKPIIAVPLSQHFPELSTVKEFRSKQVLLSHDRSKLFDVVSSKYRVVQHGEALDTIENALQEYFGKSADIKPSVRSLDGGARVIAEYKLPIKPIKIAGHDVSELSITARNSYDRTWPLDARLTAFRLICSNGATIGESFGSMSLKHVGAEPSALLANLDTIIQRAPRLKELWTEWADTRIERDEAVELLDGQFPQKYLEPILGDHARYPMSRWDLYNHLTRFSTHDTRSLRRRVEFDDKISQLFYADAV